MIKIENIKAFTALNKLREYNGKNPYLKKLKNELISKGKLSLTSTQEEYIISNFDFEPYKVDRVIGISEYLGEEFKKKYELSFVPNKMYIGFILGENEKSFHVFGKLKKNQKQNEMYWVPKTQIMEDPYYTPVDIDIDFEKYEEKDKLGRKLYEHQKDGTEFLVSRKKAILADDMGLGKVIANDTPVLTPDGWVNHGSLVIGDYVIGSNGKPTRVTGVYPNPIKDYYQITFTDGSVVEACDEHLWAVQTPTQKKNNRGYNILTIKDMLDKDKTITIRGKGYNSDKKYTSKTFYKMKNGDCKWYIPMVKPVEFNEKPVSLDPYLLGVLLGDGSLSQRNITLTNADSDLITEVESVLPNNILLSNYKKDISFGFKMADPKAGNTLKFGLNTYNLMGTKSHNKFIPDDYKYNSIDVRLGVLQGLLDTDGWCSKSDGTIQYYSISKQLSDDTKELVQSFGGVARQTKKIGKYKLPNGEVKECNTCYVLTINLPENILPFRLKRKLDNMKAVKKYHPSRGIKKIEFSRKTLGQCISVEAEDNLYVIDNYVVTHNTIQSVMGTLAAESKKVLIICPSSTKINWEREINMFGEYDTSIISGRKWKPAKYTIINYDILKNFHTVKKRGEKPIEELTHILDEKFDTLIVDEAHYLKNHKSIRGSIVTDLVKKNAFENVWLLTGTPVANRPKDLYNLLKIIGHPLSDNWQFYVKRYCDAKNFKKKMKNGKIKNIWVIDGNSNLNELSIRIKNKVLRRMKEDVLDMPEKTIIPVFNELTSKEWVEYDNLWEEYLIKRKEQKKRGKPQRDLVELILLRQFIALKSIPNTIELAENAIEDDKKIIIFTTFTDELLELQEHFGNQCVVHNGSMSDKDKQFSVDEFQNNPKKKVFIGNIMSAGVGITLTAADTVIFNSFDWVPGNNEQAEDRSYRIGQKNNVSVYYQLFEDTISTRMWYTLKHKKNVIDQIIGNNNDMNEIIKDIIE